MRKKLVPLFAIAFVVAVISTAIFYSLFASRLNSLPANHGPRINVIIAARDLAPGAVVREQDVRAMAWSGDEVPNGAYSAIEQVAGKTVFQAIARGEPLTAARVSGKDGNGIGVPEGMRAVSVHISDSSGVVALLKPGYKVDVQMFASRAQRTAGKAEMITLLRGATVLAVNAQAEQSSQGYFTAPVVTLVASAADAQQLALADSFARLRLTLRNPLEPIAAPSPPDRSAPAQSPVRPAAGMGVRLKAIGLTDEALATLASRIDARIRSGALNVMVAPGAADFASVTRLLGSGEWEAQPESVLPPLSRTTSWVQLGASSVRMRVGVAPAGGRTLRVRSELAETFGGRGETRSIETALDVSHGSLIVISGLDAALRGDTRFRHLVVLVIPEPQPLPKAAG